MKSSVKTLKKHLKDYFEEAKTFGIKFFNNENWTVRKNASGKRKLN